MTDHYAEAEVCLKQAENAFNSGSQAAELWLGTAQVHATLAAIGERHSADEVAPLKDALERVVKLLNECGAELEKILDTLDDPERAYALREMATTMKCWKIK